MNNLARYVSLQCAMLALLVGAALTGAFWLVQSLRLVQLAVDRGIGIGLFLELLVLSLPQLLQLVTPWACFIGVLFTYNKLIGDSELIVMRACGSSQLDLARPALVVAAFGTVVMFSLSLYLLPASKAKFKDLQFQIRDNFTSGLLQEGAFTSLSENLTVYVRSRSDEALEGLLLEDKRDPVKRSTFTAQSGLITEIDGHPTVVMINGTKQVWDGTKQELSVLTFDRYSLDLDQFHDASATRTRDPDERYLPDLFYPTDIDQGSILAGRLQVEGHNRLISPLYCFSFIAVALACLLTGELNRRGQARRLMIANVLVALIQAASLGLLNLAARGVGGILLMYLTAFAPIGGGIGVLLVGRNSSQMFGRMRAVPVGS